MLLFELLQTTLCMQCLRLALDSLQMLEVATFSLEFMITSVLDCFLELQGTDLRGQKCTNGVLRLILWITQN